MNTPLKNFWEEQVYSQGAQLNKYPYDSVVSFISRNYPRHKPRDQVNILEVGCGAGNNLWFAAREGFSVTGIDISPSAIAFARQRFTAENLKGEFHVGPFSPLPFVEESFDLVIDRGSLCCVSFPEAKNAVNEIHRVLHKSGRFFSTGYSRECDSFKSSPLDADTLLSHHITTGSMAGYGDICFYDEHMLRELVPTQQWRILNLKHKIITDLAQNSNTTTHAEWETVAEKL